MGTIITGGGVFTDPSWHLDRIEVDAPLLGKTFVFPAGRWLAKDEDDGALEVILYPGAGGDKGAVVEFKPKKQWEVVVYTSDIKWAGTDANVSMEVYGRDDHGVEFKDICEFKSQATDESFERGTEDHFAFSVDGGITEPYKIRVWHDNKHMGADWHLEKVVMLDVAAKKRFEFDCGQWFSDSKGDKKISRELGLSRKLALGESGGVEEQHIDKIATVDYELHVTTANAKNAGTDAHITMVIFGENGDSGPLNLSKSRSGKDKFEKGNTDVFDLPGLLDLGSIFRVSVRSDNHKGLHMFKPQWLCERIEVVAVGGDTVRFDCGPQWFSKGEGLEHSFDVPRKKKKAQSVMNSSSPAMSKAAAATRKASASGERLSQTSTAASRARASASASARASARGTPTGSVRGSARASASNSRRGSRAGTPSGSGRTSPTLQQRKNVSVTGDRTGKVRAAPVPVSTPVVRTMPSLSFFFALFHGKNILVYHKTCRLKITNMRQFAVSSPRMDLKLMRLPCSLAGSRIRPPTPMCLLK